MHISKSSPPARRNLPPAVHALPRPSMPFHGLPCPSTASHGLPGPPTAFSRPSTAFPCTQEERPSREARAELLRGLHTLLAEIRHLVEETSAFNGHAAFVEEGFVEGLSY